MTDLPPSRGRRGPEPEVTRAWDQYWRDGRLASCGGAGGANYQKAVSEGWKRFFRGLEPGARILDACTGNGAIAHLAAETAIECGIRFAIDAFDSAAIAPVRSASASEEMIQFRRRVAAESLPYANGSFDCVVGQYAIEYTQLDRSLGELARVSGSGCRVRFVTHAADGIVVEAARHQLADIDRLSQTFDIFAAARDVVESRAAGAAEDTRRRAEIRYRQGLVALQRAAGAAVEPAMYHNVCSVIDHALSQQRRVGPQLVLDKIGEVEATLNAHALRLEAMSRAALDEPQARHLTDLAASAWRQPFRFAPLARGDGACLGWLVESAGAGESPGAS